MYADYTDSDTRFLVRRLYLWRTQITVRKIPLCTRILVRRIGTQIIPTTYACTHVRRLYLPGYASIDPIQAGYRHVHCVSQTVHKLICTTTPHETFVPAGTKRWAALPLASQSTQYLLSSNFSNSHKIAWCFSCIAFCLSFSVLPDILHILTIAETPTPLKTCN